MNTATTDEDAVTVWAATGLAAVLDAIEEGAKTSRAGWAEGARWAAQQVRDAALSGTIGGPDVKLLARALGFDEANAGVGLYRIGGWVDLNEIATEYARLSGSARVTSPSPTPEPEGGK